MYSTSSGTIKFSSLTIGTVKLDKELINQLLNLWQNIFRSDYESFRGILAGEECEDNRDIIYLATLEGRIIGTAHLTVALKNPELGGLGEVCTVPEFRGKGIASTLCTMAREDFNIAGGKALFLGTDNPQAAFVYRRLGWRKLAGANVMALHTKGESPESFLCKYFDEPGKITIVRGTPAERIPVIPLIVTPHDWQVMDANIDIFSTRYITQKSCMGLYPRYASLDNNNCGAWFAARNDLYQTLGLSTVRFDSSEKYQVDGFMHNNYSGSWELLIQSAIYLAISQEAQVCWGRVSVEDEEKISLFESLSFKKTGKGYPFNFEGREVASVCLELNL